MWAVLLSRAALHADWIDHKDGDAAAMTASTSACCIHSGNGFKYLPNAHSKGSTAFELRLVKPLLRAGPSQIPVASPKHGVIGGLS